MGRLLSSPARRFGLQTAIATNLTRGERVEGVGTEYNSGREKSSSRGKKSIKRGERGSVNKGREVSMYLFFSVLSGGIWGNPEKTGKEFCGRSTAQSRRAGSDGLMRGIIGHKGQVC